jgi:hypothetical protein
MAARNNTPYCLPRDHSPYLSTRILHKEIQLFFKYKYRPYIQEWLYLKYICSKKLLSGITAARSYTPYCLPRHPLALSAYLHLKKQQCLWLFVGLWSALSNGVFINCPIDTWSLKRLLIVQLLIQLANQWYEMFWFTQEGFVIANYRAPDLM